MQEEDKTKKKDVAIVVATSKENLALKEKMMEWKVKTEELKAQLEKLMKQK